MKIEESLTPETGDALLAICLMAAMCDGEKSEVERAEVRRIADELGSSDPAALSRKILMGRLSLDQVVSRIASPAQRLLAYEMALAVCEADDLLSESEKSFLGELSTALEVNGEPAKQAAQEVDAIVLAPVVSPSAQPVASDNSGMILNYAILNGALELLPESLATMAILPLQMKMVYRIGKTHGVEMDRSRIKEFLAVAGVGIGSQMLEGFARKFLGGFGKNSAVNSWGKQLTRSLDPPSRSAQPTRLAISPINTTKAVSVWMPTRRGLFLKPSKTKPLVFTPSTSQTFRPRPARLRLPRSFKWSRVRGRFEIPPSSHEELKNRDKAAAPVYQSARRFVIAKHG